MPDAIFPVADSVQLPGNAEKQDESGRGPLAAGLYLVATPIGNLEDITLRALRVLREADRIACEDTRQTQKLLNHYGIRTPTMSCHQHNERERAQEIVALLGKGGRIAVVSDAGMPGISDPGMHLAGVAMKAGFKVIPVPGANAALTALVASGFDTGRFLFVGFLPAREAARRDVLEKLASSLGEDEGPLTVIFYEAPHRIVATLAGIERAWGGDVRVAIARELTKLHEEFLRGSAVEVRAVLEARDRIRGEIVLLVEARRPASGVSQTSVAKRVEELVCGGVDRKEALKRVARERGLSRSEAYRELQQSKR